MKKPQRPTSPASAPVLLHSWLKNALDLHKSKRFDEARAVLDRVLQMAARHPTALHLKGLGYAAQEQYRQALTWLEAAARLTPDDPMVCMNLANAYKETGQWEAALVQYDKALQLRPDYAPAFYNRGVVLMGMNRLRAAVEDFKRSAEITPNVPEPYLGGAQAYNRLGEHMAARFCLSKLYGLQNKPLDSLYLEGTVLREMERLPEAAEVFGRVYAADPEFRSTSGFLAALKRYLCDWDDQQRLLEPLLRQLLNGKCGTTPFDLLALADDPQAQQRCARLALEPLEPMRKLLPAIPARQKKSKIKVGYYSADYFNHATMFLMAELFELHDRDAFEWIAFSFGPAADDTMHRRAQQSFDQFIDVREMSDLELAKLSREMEIDIAVDLKGHTKDNRAGAFVIRLAPIQVSYIGFPGTLGMAEMDYIVADPVVLPEAEFPYYDEKVVQLPHSYQVNDRKRKIADETPARVFVGLPETGFVFCCFNNNYKITPEVMDLWARILAAVPGSVLWLLQSNPTSMENLCREAEHRGIERHRLVFAPKMPNDVHLARHRLADLFLDTWPYNAHTTTSDALWAGVPVLACPGRAFASRVAASLVTAAGLPEMVVDSPQAYVDTAVALAHDPERLSALKAKLLRARTEAPLFDTERFARHIEAAYKTMYERYHAGLPPDHIRVQANA